MKYSVKKTLKIIDGYHYPGDTIDLKEKDPETETLLQNEVIAPFDPNLAKKIADAKKPPANFEDDLTQIKGIGSDLEFAIKGIGIKNFEQLAKAPVDRLANLPGITETSAKRIISAANKKVKAKIPK